MYSNIDIASTDGRNGISSNRTGKEWRGLIVRETGPGGQLDPVNKLEAFRSVNSREMGQEYVREKENWWSEGGRGGGERERESLKFSKNVQVIFEVMVKWRGWGGERERERERISEVLKKMFKSFFAARASRLWEPLCWKCFQLGIMSIATVFEQCAHCVHVQTHRHKHTQAQRGGEKDFQFPRHPRGLQTGLTFNSVFLDVAPVTPWIH